MGWLKNQHVVRPCGSDVLWTCGQIESDVNGRSPLDKLSVAASNAAQMPVTILLLSGVLLVAVDQATKALVISRFRGGGAASFGRIAIRSVINRPARHGFVNSNDALVTLWVIEVCLLLALVRFWLPGSVVTQVALGVALGGATGNLFDRLWRGGVVDFIDVGIWPVFNVADSAIVAGAIAAALSIH